MKYLTLHNYETLRHQTEQGNAVAMERLQGAVIDFQKQSEVAAEAIRTGETLTIVVEGQDYRRIAQFFSDFGRIVRYHGDNPERSKAEAAEGRESFKRDTDLITGMLKLMEQVGGKPPEPKPSDPAPHERAAAPKPEIPDPVRQALQHHIDRCTGEACPINIQAKQLGLTPNRKPAAPGSPDDSFQQFMRELAAASESFLRDPGSRSNN